MNLLEKYPTLAKEQLNISPSVILDHILSLTEKIGSVQLNAGTRMDINEITTIDRALDHARTALVYTLRVYEELAPRLRGTPLTGGSVSIGEFLTIAHTIRTIDKQIEQLGLNKKLAQLTYLEKYFQSQRNQPPQSRSLRQ